MEKPVQPRRSKAKRIILGTRALQRAELFDDEIAELIPSLSPKEFAQIERTTLAEGCCAPLLAPLGRGTPSRPP
jgi:hypothetical protein